jgi:hypothetical protein
MSQPLVKPAAATVPSRNCNELQMKTTLRRQDAFLEAYAKAGIISPAAAVAGISLDTIYSWTTQDTYGFKSRRAEAESIALGVLESEIHRRAVEGIDKDIIYKGEKCGTTKEYSDNLLMFRTKRLDPKYKDNFVPTEARPTTATQINIHLSSANGEEIISIDKASATQLPSASDD